MSCGIFRLPSRIPFGRQVFEDHQNYHLPPFSPFPLLRTSWLLEQVVSFFGAHWVSLTSIVWRSELVRVGNRDT